MNDNNVSENICEDDNVKTEDFGKVSVIMPVYNSGEYIKNSVMSVLNQTYSNFELIIVDDCSTDNSLDIIETFDDERIKLYKNEHNSGAAVTRNNGIKKSSGKWIAFIDSDDIWDDKKLYCQLKFMTENKVAFSFTQYDVIDEEGKTVAVFRPKKDIFTYKDILKHCSAGCSTVIYNKEILGEVLMPVNAEKREDFACWLSILKRGYKGYCVKQTLAKYRVRSNSVSSSKFEMIKYQYRVYRKNEKLNFFKSIYYLFHWAVRGLFKYKKIK